MAIHLTISDDIFARFPEYCRGVVVAHGIQNGASPAELLAELRAAESAQSTQVSADAITTHPRIESWREAYRSLGVKPSEYRPSVEGLLRRVVKKDPLPSIGTVVDLGNLVSIQNLVPVGAHATDVINQDIELRFAGGDEVFEPFGSDVIESPQPGEIIFVEGKTVLTRRWTWRQAKHTLVVPGTTAVEINIDGLPPVTLGEVEKICQLMTVLVQKYCGGFVRYDMIHRNHSSINLS